MAGPHAALDRAQALGKAAREAGCTLDANPYGWGGYCWIEWRRGFLGAAAFSENTVASMDLASGPDTTAEAHFITSNGRARLVQARTLNQAS